MSIKLMSAVWDRYDTAEGQAARKLVLMAFADAASDEGYCWPSVRAIAAKCGISERQTRRHIDALRHEKWLESDPRFRHGSQTSNMWRIVLPDAAVGGDADDRGGVTPTTGGGSDAHDRGGWRPRQGGDDAHDRGGVTPTTDRIRNGSPRDPQGGEKIPQGPAGGGQKNYLRRTASALRASGAICPDQKLAKEWLTRIACICGDAGLNPPPPTGEDDIFWPQVAKACLKAAKNMTPTRPVRWPSDLTTAHEPAVVTAFRGVLEAKIQADIRSADTVDDDQEHLNE